ncbi:zincin-like metallopeptidase domain-containing protein, partial [Acidithiobacillus sp.]|uniref:zincin-like metallopeptidase domain-containing protein n=1 Tax=Acidithiobacillus sp. TaxID=1872118 RepID=UPI003D0934CA
EIDALKAQGVEDPKPTEQRMGVRYYTVFHASQIDGIPPLERPERHHQLEGEPDPRLDKLAETMGVPVGRGGGRAFYRPSEDRIQMPNREDFHTAAGHDTTLLHELAHATGHESRLNRDMVHPFGSEKYAIEELRAEMSAAMTAAALGIGFDPASQNMEEGREMGNSAAYLASWLKALPENERKHIIVQAINDAQNISDYLIERTPELTIASREQAVEVAAPEPTIAAPVAAEMAQTPEIRPLSVEDIEHPAIAQDAEGEALRVVFWSKVHDAPDIARHGLEGASEAAQVRVAKVLRLSTEDYDRLTSRLLDDQSVLQSIGGTDSEDRSRYVVDVRAPERQRLLLDTQGYNYPRYVGIPAGDVERVLERGSFVTGPEKQLDNDLVDFLKERQQIREGEHPGFAGLSDPVENADAFVREYAMRNPEEAITRAILLREQPDAYAQTIGLSPDSLRSIASQLEAGARRMESPSVGDLVRFEPNDPKALRAMPFSGRVIAVLDTSGGDFRYHLRAETGPGKGNEARVYGKEGTFRAIGLEQAVGFDRDIPLDRSVSIGDFVVRYDKNTRHDRESVVVGVGVASVRMQDVYRVAPQEWKLAHTVTCLDADDFRASLKEQVQGVVSPEVASGNLGSAAGQYRFLQALRTFDAEHGLPERTAPTPEQRKEQAIRETEGVDPFEAKRRAVVSALEDLGWKKQPVLPGDPPGGDILQKTFVVHKDPAMGGGHFGGKSEFETQATAHVRTNAARVEFGDNPYLVADPRAISVGREAPSAKDVAARLDRQTREGIAKTFVHLGVKEVTGQGRSAPERHETHSRELSASAPADQAVSVTDPQSSRDGRLVSSVKGRDGAWYNLSVQEKGGQLIGALQRRGPEGGLAESGGESPFQSVPSDTKKLAAKFQMASGEVIAARLSTGEEGVVRVDLFARSRERWEKIHERPGRLRANEALQKIPEHKEGKLIEQALGVDPRVLQPTPARSMQNAPERAPGWQKRQEMSI